MGFKKNLRYLIVIWGDGEEKKFADIVGWRDHTLRRLLRGQQAPLPQHFFALQKAFGVTDAMMNAPHARFLQLSVPELRRDIGLATPECVKDDWPRTILLKGALGDTTHILYWLSGSARSVCGAEFLVTGFDREGIHIAFSYHRDVRTRNRQGRLICVGDFIYLNAWPKEGSHQLIYGVLANHPTSHHMPFDGWWLYPSTFPQGDGIAAAVVRSRIRLSPTPTFSGNGAESLRRRYISQRTGVLTKPPDDDVRAFFAPELSAR